MNNVTKTVALAFVAAVSAGVHADTAVWTKTDTAYAYWGTAWSDSSCWQDGLTPENGWDVSFPNQPSVDKVWTFLSSYANYNVGSISGRSEYDILLCLTTSLTLDDASGFYGTIKAGPNTVNGWTHNQGYNSSWSRLVLSATAERTPIVNVLDTFAGLQVDVANDGTCAEVKSVVSSGPGWIEKTGNGELVAAFGNAGESALRVASGKLTLKSGTEDEDGGHLMLAANTSVGVAAGNTVKMPDIVVESTSLVKEGAGTLEIGQMTGLANASDYGMDGKYGQMLASTAPNIMVNAGSVSVAPARSFGARDITTEPVLHLDASAADTIASAVVSGVERVTEWRDPVSGRSAVAGFSEDYGAVGPRLVSNALNGKPILDFGVFVEAQNGQKPGGDWYNLSDYDLSDSAALRFPDAQVLELFLVVRTKEYRKQPFYLGSVSSYNNYPFSPEGDGRLVGGYAAESVKRGQWRIDGAMVRCDSFLPDQDFHVVSVALPEMVYNLNTIGLDRHCRVGGMELAELVVYNTRLQPDERRAIEEYLSEKWLAKPHPLKGSASIGSLSFANGVAAQLNAERNVSVGSISGSGTFTKSGAGDVTAMDIADTITGLAVTGGSLSFPSAGSPLDVMNEASFHIDPSDPTTLVKSGDNVTQINDVRGLGSVNRYAFTSAQSKASGPTLVKTPDTNLDMLDFGPFGGNYGIAQSDTTCGMQWNQREQVFTVCLVVEKIDIADHDSFILGDTSVYDFHGDNGCLIAGNCHYGLRPPQSDFDPKWTFDGKSVSDPTTTAWTAGPHVITISVKDTNPNNGIRNAGPWASMFAQDRSDPCRVGGLRYGEVVVFTNSISQAQVKAISSYLMEKWIGGEKDTSSGLQSLSVASGASLSYDGDITVADGSTVEIGYGSQGRSGTISVGGEVLLGRNVEVSVADGRGEVAVISADSFANTAALSTWTLNGKTGKLYVRGDVLYARCGGGMMIMIR